MTLCGSDQCFSSVGASQESHFPKVFSEDTTSELTPYISVIIPTHNRSDLLGKTLESLVNQTISNEYYEVLVIDNGSIDNTLGIVDSFKNRQKNIRYFYEPQPGLHNGRHKGFIEADSNLLVFIDDDIEAFPTWLQAILDSFEDEEVVMVGGKCLPKFETAPPEWLDAMWLSSAAGERILSCLSLIDLGDDTKSVDPNYIFGCNFAIRRSVLHEAGGFHPDAMPQGMLRFRGDGETAVSAAIRRLGYKAVYNPRASIYHSVPKERMTYEYFYKRSFAQGVSDSYTEIRRTGGVLFLSSTRFFLKSIRERIACAVVRPSAVISEVWKTIRRGYWDGVAFHIREVRSDPSLLQWVLKTDYWENPNG